MLIGEKARLQAAIDNMSQLSELIEQHRGSDTYLAYMRKLVPNVLAYLMTRKAALSSQGHLPDDEEMLVAALAHRVCHSAEHDPEHGRIHGYCVVCGVPWPCDTAKRFLSSGAGQRDVVGCEGCICTRQHNVPECPIHGRKAVPQKWRTPATTTPLPLGRRHFSSMDGCGGPTAPDSLTDNQEAK